jgi:trans-aconitate 2-methyltransferase
MSAYEFDGERYRAAAGHQREWGELLIAGLELQGDENILDLGCGDGALTARLADLVPRGLVLGLDASAGMIAATRPLTRSNLRFALQDISTLDFEDEFDLIFSNSALHWLNDQPRLLAACHRALKKGGRLCGGFPGAGSVRVLSRRSNRSWASRSIGAILPVSSGPGACPRQAHMRP